MLKSQTLTDLYYSSQPQLVQACFHGDPDEVRALLYKKEDVNYQVRVTCEKIEGKKSFMFYKHKIAINIEISICEW